MQHDDAERRQRQPQLHDLAGIFEAEVEHEKTAGHQGKGKNPGQQDTDRIVEHRIAAPAVVDLLMLGKNTEQHGTDDEQAQIFFAERLAVNM
ncbi:hypothetical protein [Methylomonas koyamae]|uniref:hypothetical protein n=1 Tax=Methylomonas koyamae TaxID=702114 RepID=UPI000ACCEBAC